MVPSFIYNMPGAAGLFMVGLLAMRRPKNRAQRLLLGAMGVIEVLMLADTYYLSALYAPGLACAIVDTVFMLLYPVIPLMIYRILSELGHQPLEPRIGWWAVVPMLTGVWQWGMIAKEGYAFAHRWAMVVFFLLMVGYAIWVYMVVRKHQLPPSLRQRHAMRAFLRGKAVSTYYIYSAQVDTFFLMVVLFHLVDGLWEGMPEVAKAVWAVVATLLVCEVGALGWFFDAETLALADFIHPLVTDSEVEAYRQSLLDDYDATANAVRWFSRIRHVMEDEKLFLQRDLTVEQVASAVGTNSYYVSRAVHRELGLNFRAYVHRLRIDYAKQYMQAHPEAKQDEIADECGYANAIVFNKQFVALEGQTPKEWKKGDRGGKS